MKQLHTTVCKLYICTRNKLVLRYDVSTNQQASTSAAHSGSAAQRPSLSSQPPAHPIDSMASAAAVSFSFFEQALSAVSNGAVLAPIFTFIGASSISSLLSLRPGLRASPMVAADVQWVSKTLAAASASGSVVFPGKYKVAWADDATHVPIWRPSSEGPLPWSNPRRQRLLPRWSQLQCLQLQRKCR